MKHMKITVIWLRSIMWWWWYDDMMIRGIKSSLVKLILAEINFAYIVNIVCCLWNCNSLNFWELINHWWILFVLEVSWILLNLKGIISI